MLPTTGYFKNFSCPFYETCICERPYCHYRHFKQDTIQDANVISDLVSKAVHKVLNSTSTQVKTNEKEGDKKRVTYNPTPIATLNKYKTNSYSSSEKRVKHNHIPYSPEQPVKANKLDETLEYDVGDYVNTSVGYSPTPKSSSVQYIPSAIDSLYQNQNSAQNGLNQSYEPVKLHSADNLNLDVKYNPTNNEELSLNENTSNDYVPNYNDDFIDTFLSDPNIYEPTEITPSNSAKSVKTSEKTSKTDSKRTKSDLKHSKSDKKTTKTDQKTKPDDSSTKTDGKSSKSTKKHEKSHHNSRSSSSSSSSKDKNRSKSESKVDSKTDAKSDKTDSKSDKTDPKSDKKRSNSADKRSSDRMKKDDTKRSTSKENGKSSHKENGKSNHKSKSSKDREKSKSKSTTTTTTTKEETKTKPEVDPDFDILSDDFFDDDDMSDGEIDMNTLEQCKRIFDEYEAAPIVEPAPKVVEAPAKDDGQSAFARKRTAHEGSSNAFRPKVSKPNHVKSAAMVMADRYKNIMANLKEKQSFNTTNSKKDDYSIKITETPKPIIAPIVVAPKVILTTMPAKPVQTQPEYSQIQVPGRNSRIAHVPNVSSLINAKKKIAEIKKKPDLSKTPMTTLAKGSKRVAHTPELSAADIPPVLQSEKSKLAVNVRSRFLLLMVTECMKIYHDKESSYERALNEELSCYLKCSVLTTYRNSCMLTINRLRKESEGISTGGSLKNNDAAEFIGNKFYENLHRWVLTEEELVENGYPRPGASKKGYAVIKNNKPVERVPEGSQLCVRCKKMYPVDEDGFPVYPEDCIYHPGSRFVFRGEPKYICCRETSAAIGCCICSTHVFETRDPNNLSGFVCTFEPDTANDPKSFKVFALDCEMVYTTRGFELARVTIINHKCDVVYENMVRPLGHILDCNTRYSGLTTEMLESVSTKITEVQASLLLLFNSKTILIGHSLESDLKALRLIHNTVIDTAVLFPHKMGPPKKRGLRSLASDILKKIIQNSESGHDSAEDAITCMELVVWKLKEELKTR